MEWCPYSLRRGERATEGGGVGTGSLSLSSSVLSVGFPFWKEEGSVEIEGPPLGLTVPGDRLGLPYLGDELEKGIGVESSNRQSYEVEQQPLVKSLLHEGYHAGPHEGAEGNDGHTEETVPPHCRWESQPTQDREKGQGPNATATTI